MFASGNGTFGDEIFQSDSTIRQMKLTEYNGVEAFLFQYFTKSNLVFGLFQWFIFILAES